MKKLWENYSYAIILLAFSLLFSLVAKAQLNTEDAYITVTIEEGQSLWEIAQSFAGEHHLSENEFISWVEKENGIVGKTLLPGDELVIPVEAEQIELAQLADAER